MPPKSRTELTDEDRQAEKEAVTPLTMGDLMVQQASVPVQVAIARIIKELPAIQKKAGDPDSGVAYKFRGIEDLVAHLAPLLAKHGVVIVPSTELVTINTEVENSKGKMSGWTEVVLRVTWTIVGPAGDTLTAATVGIGRDNSDKGSNKAQTQAFKYLLMELFAIGDKEDDSDGEAPPQEPPVRSAPASARPVTGPAREAPAAASPPVPPAPPSTIDPQRASQQVSLPPDTIARMDALYATQVAGKTLTVDQWTGKIAPVSRNVNGPVGDLAAMLADDKVWAAVAIKFGVGQG